MSRDARHESLRRHFGTARLRPIGEPKHPAARPTCRSATSGDAETTGKVGEAVTNAGTTYEVTHVQDTDTIGDPDLLGARAAGTFVARQ
jgi:hypothetical protein